MLYLFAAPVLAVALMLILMPGCIKELRKLKFGQTMYELGPQTHLNKKGTPNMGGLVIGLVTVVVTVLFAALNYSRLAKNGGELARWWTLDNGLWGLLFVALGAMAIGFTTRALSLCRRWPASWWWVWSFRFGRISMWAAT